VLTFTLDAPNRRCFPIYPPCHDGRYSRHYRKVSGTSILSGTSFPEPCLSESTPPFRRPHGRIMGLDLPTVTSHGCRRCKGRSRRQSALERMPRYRLDESTGLIGYNTLRMAAKLTARFSRAGASALAALRLSCMRAVARSGGRNLLSIWRTSAGSSRRALLPSPFDYGDVVTATARMRGPGGR
jgi:glycine/serine hydroxymethyltransferase